MTQIKIQEIELKIEKAHMYKLSRRQFFILGLLKMKISILQFILIQDAVIKFKSLKILQAIIEDLFGNYKIHRIFTLQCQPIQEQS